MEGKPYKKFYELEIWKEGLTLVEEVYEVTKKYPSEEKYALVDQTRRSSNSVIANIAEAHGRFHFKDKIRVFYIARGEIEETQSHIWVAHTQHYISKEQWIDIEKRYENLKIKLNNSISSLRKQDKEQSASIKK